MTVEPRSAFADLIDACRTLPLLRTAIVHPCNDAAVAAAAEAHALGLIEPVFVGPAAKIRAAAAAAKVDLSPFRVVDAPHSHAAAEIAVKMVRAGEIEALMKGSLHTDELMAAVVEKETGLRTARRISHCYVMHVPAHPGPLIITDAAINIAPTLDEKADIVRNAVDLAVALGFGEVRVAVLSATETVNPKVPSTIEAAALSKMADRGQITGAWVDGPLALDNAVDLGAAAIKNIASPVSGRANVLVVPDLESGNMLAKSLSFLAAAEAAGIVLGARVPIMLTSRSDTKPARLASAAVAVLLADFRRRTLAAVVS